MEDAAAKVDLNPGLVGTITAAETETASETCNPLSYLSSGKVASYCIGVDYFYEGRAAIAQRVPAYAKVGWEKNQVSIVHPNDAITPRNVKTIFFTLAATRRWRSRCTSSSMRFGCVSLRLVLEEISTRFLSKRVSR